MSKLDELISELCPNGVEYKKLGEIGNFYGGLSGKTKNDFVNGNARFIAYMDVYLHSSISEISGIVEIAENEHQNNIECGDIFFTGSSETRDECAISSVLTENIDDIVYLNSFCFGYRLNDKPKFDLNFLKHLFRSNCFRKQIPSAVNGVTRFNVSKKKFANLVIPVPPLDIQKEIANILDKFSLLEEELEEELEERRKQYEYYLNMLLMYDEFISQENHMEHKTLGELCDITTGKLNANAKVENGLYPFYTCDESPYLINNYAFDTTAIIISGNGSQVGHINYYSGKFNAYQRTYVLDQVHDVEFKYLLYYLKAHLKNYIVVNSKKGSVPYITLPMLTSFMIDIPSIDTQKHLVDILDRFDKITSSLTEGIPAEIRARHQQYEYYRDKLLTFDRIN